MDTDKPDLWRSGTDKSDISFEALSEFRDTIQQTISPLEAWRVIKTWRALWNVCSAMQLCRGKQDPSLAIRNSAPMPRSSFWNEGEVVRLVKMAWHRKYHGLAVRIAFAWDTQLSPGDLRGLTVAVKGEGKERYFRIGRAKSGRTAIGTAGRRSLALLDAYLEKESCDGGKILRNRRGAVYSRYTLPDDFGVIRELCFPGDRRTLADMRRSGQSKQTRVEPHQPTLLRKWRTAYRAQTQSIRPINLSTWRVLGRPTKPA